MKKSFLKDGFEKGKEIFYSRQENILSAAFIMMVLVGATKVAGFVKLHILARLFGASRQLDIFWAASTLPDLIYWVIVAGSINAALIPVFAKLANRSDQESKQDFSKLFSQVINFVSLILAFFSFLIFIFAPQISYFVSRGGVNGITPDLGGFSYDEVAHMAYLMRIMSIAPIIMGVSSVFSSALQANKRFIVPAIAPLFYNIGIIIGAVVFAGIFNMGETGLALGVVLGGVLHLLIQLPLARSLGLGIKLRYKVWDENVKNITVLAFPRILALLGEQINVVINTIISTRLIAGSLSAYKFGSSLYLLPVQLFSNTIAQASLPTLSLSFKQCSRDDHECDLFVRTFHKSFQQILFFTLPSVVVVLVLRLPIVRISLGAGRFDWQDTIITSWVLALFSIAILGQSLHALVIRSFYAMNETVKPLLVSIVGLIFSVLGAILFTNFFSHYYDWRPIVGAFLERPTGLYSEFWSDLLRWFTTNNSSIAAVGGLPLSIGIASMVEVFILMILLNKKLPIFSWKGFFQPILRKAFAAFLMFWVMYTLYKFWHFGMDTSRVISIASLLLTVGGVGGLVYLGTCIVIDVSEVNFFVDILKKGAARIKKVFSK